MSIESEVLKLNREQQDAVRTISGPLLVLAGAGTGKTKVITTRIAYMLSMGIPPHKIVAVSFTNKAAREMRERVAHLVGQKKAKEVELSTFHSFALKLLRQYAVHAGLRTRFSIADERESQALLKEALREQSLQDFFSLPYATQRMSYLKDQCLRGEDLDKRTAILDKALLKNLFIAYNRRLRLYNLVDFDDIIYLLVLLFRDKPELLSDVQELYSHLMVDEYQDTSVCQFNLIRMLGAKSQNVCVVGDDDQSIYSWRGANPESIQEFLNAFHGTKRVTLEQNYRCSPNILNVANAVIAENKNRLGKTLWSRQDNEHHITIHKAESERDEALFVADKIASLLAENPGLKESDIAILVRANNQAIPLEQVFEERKIKYTIHGGTKFFDRKEIRDVVSYLKLAHNPCDLNSLFRVINQPSRGIGIGTLEKIKHNFETARAQHSKASLDETLHNLALEHKGVADFYERWHGFRDKLRNANEQTGIVEVLRECFERVGLKEDIMQNAANMQAANFRIDLVEKFLEMAKNVELEDKGLSGLVDALHLDEPQFERAKDKEKGVQVMTMHAAKGLEFPYVFIVGAEENIIPHERSIETELGVEEERRLFYVAITRAKRKLFISHCIFRNKAMGASKREPVPSRFLSSVPEKFLDKTESDGQTEEARKMAAAKRLFELFR